jgi:hypothetical protein
MRNPLADRIMTNGKAPKVVIEVKAVPPNGANKASVGNKLLTRSVCKTRWRVDLVKVGGLFF